jgi:hypothetical protein
MGKISKKLHFKRNGTTYDINLYNSKNDVGPLYITLKIDGAQAYAQIGAPGTESATAVIVNKGGTVYAVKNKAEDLSLLSSGTISNTGSVGNAVVLGPTSYYGTGQNAIITWKTTPTWTAQTNSDILTRFVITINPSITLSDTHHYRLKYVNSISVDVSETDFIDLGTISAASRVFTVDVPADKQYFFRVYAEDASNNVLYSSPVYQGIKTAWPDSTTAGITYAIYTCQSDGSSATQAWTGAFGSTTADITLQTPSSYALYTASGTTVVGTGSQTLVTGVTPSGGVANQANLAVTPPALTAKRYFYHSAVTAHPWTGDSGIRNTAIACADTCSCNCNYCTCNCNYCTCNCNYCTCNCNYYPCSCSSCSCGTC